MDRVTKTDWAAKNRLKTRPFRSSKNCTKRGKSRLKHYHATSKTLKKRRTGFRRRSPDCSCGFATASRKKYKTMRREMEEALEGIFLCQKFFITLIQSIYFNHYDICLILNKMFHENKLEICQICDHYRPGCKHIIRNSIVTTIFIPSQLS